MNPPKTMFQLSGVHCRFSSGFGPMHARMRSMADTLTVTVGHDSRTLNPKTPKS